MNGTGYPKFSSFRLTREISGNSRLWQFRQYGLLSACAIKKSAGLSVLRQKEQAKCQQWNFIFSASIQRRSSICLWQSSQGGPIHSSSLGLRFCRVPNGGPYWAGPMRIQRLSGSSRSFSSSPLGTRKVGSQVRLVLNRKRFVCFSSLTYQQGASWHRHTSELAPLLPPRSVYQVRWCLIHAKVSC